MFPKVSVIMTVYNEEKYVAGAIKSLLLQEYPNMEIVIIDDGSTDGTKNILSEFVDIDGINIVNKQNEGVYKSLKLGVSKAKGEYIAILDADDICLPGRIHKQVQFLDSNKNYGSVGGQEIAYIEDRKEFIKIDMPCDDKAIRQNWLRKQMFTHSTLMFRRSAIEKVGGYENTYGSGFDFHLFFKIANSYLVKNFDSPLAIRRHKLSSHCRSQGFRNKIKLLKLGRMSERKLGLPYYHFIWFMKYSVALFIPQRIKIGMKRLLNKKRLSKRDILKELCIDDNSEFGRLINEYF